MRGVGKCANRQGHGHNYTLEVTVAGEIDPVTGFVVDLKQLKEILEREVVSVYDHRHLKLRGAGVCGCDSNDGEYRGGDRRRLEGKVGRTRGCIG